MEEDKKEVCISNCSLRSGALSVGIFYVVVNSLSLVGMALMLTLLVEPDIFRQIMIAVAVIYAFLIIINFVLIYGIVEYVSVFVAIWIWVHVVWVTLSQLGLIVSLVFGGYTDPATYIGFLVSALLVYCITVVYRYYCQREEIKDRQLVNNVLTANQLRDKAHSLHNWQTCDTLPLPMKMNRLSENCDGFTS